MFDEYTIKDVIEEVIDYRGKTPKKLGGDWSEGKTEYMALSAKNIKKGRIVQPDTIRYVDQEMYNKWMKQEVERGTILITSEAPFGELLYWDSDDKIVLSQRLFGLKIKKEFNSRYIYYYMFSKQFQGELIGRATGSTVTGLRQPELLKCHLRVPNRKYQDIIATMLMSIDKKIYLNNEINNNLQELIDNIFISKFVNFDEYTGEYKTTEIGDIPTNWSIDNFGNIISFSNGYGWDSKDMLESSKPDTYKVFKMGNIKIGGGINKEKTKSWILKEKCSGLEQFLSKKGDVLMCMTDMKSNENPLLGHTALIDRDDEFVINQRVGLIRCDKEIKWPYIYTMTNLPFFISDIRRKAHSGVQVNLTTSGICDTKVLIPDKDSLYEFYKNVTPMYEKMFTLNNEIEYLEQLRDTLLPKLMNGEIDLDSIEI